MPPPATKRRRLSDHDQHSTFVAWAKEHGVKVNGVGPAALPGRGIGLVATRPLNAGETLVHVSPSAMLSPPPEPSALSPQANLTATLLDLSSASDSRYEHCAKVWPTASSFRSSLAWFTPSDRNLDYKHLFPSSLASAYDRLLRDAEADADALGRSVSDPDFLYHWAIANTRSFSFKTASRRQGQMVLCPLLDYMNHCPNGEGCEVRVSSKGYTLLSRRKYSKGEEILATYGAHPNDKLLAHYGFNLPSNSDDSIALDDLILANVTPDQRAALQSVGYLGNYSLTPASGEVCFRTQVAVRSLLLTSNEWEFFMGSGDDIAEDKSEAVRTWLTQTIQAGRKVMVEKMNQLQQVRDDGAGNADVLTLVLDRWTEILAALDQYIEP